MITFETDVQIERPLEGVFAYVSEPLNFHECSTICCLCRRGCRVSGRAGVDRAMSFLSQASRES
jgi:hypothetical protein